MAITDLVGHASRAVVDPPAFSPSRYFPPRQALSVPRPAITDALASAVDDKALTLLIAPGGSGKTTAMARLVAEIEPRPVVWARFESQDDDPLTVASLLLAALRVVIPDAGQRLERVLAMDSGTDLGTLAVALANDLAQHDGVTIALDDMHVLCNSESLELIDALLDSMSSGTRVIVASRRTPTLSLARRRVRGELAEFHSVDFLLDADAIAVVLDRIGVSDRGVAERILEYSGGWAAAVQLAVQGASEGRWKSQRPARPLLAGVEKNVNEFFADGIFSELPEDLRSFLMSTSLLPELTADSCNVVTGRDDSAALLDEVVRRDLFIVGFGPDASRMRYHDLFAGFLRARLTQEVSVKKLEQLRRRSASCSPTGDAIRLLIDAGDESAAARLVSDAGQAQVAGTGPHVPDAWIRMLPSSTHAGYPWVGLLTGLAQVRRGQMDQARTTLVSVVDAFQKDDDDRGLVAAKFALVESLMGLGEVHSAEELLNDLEARSLDPDDRIRVLATQVWHQFFATDWSAVSSSIEEAFELAFGSATDIGRRTLALSLGTEMLFADSGPTWLREQCLRLADAIADPGSPAGAALVTMDAAFDFFAGRLEGVLKKLARAAAISEEHGGLGWLDLMIDRLRLATALATGDHAAVDATCGAAEARLDSSAVHRQERAMYAWALARSSLMRGGPHEINAIRDRWLSHVGEGDRPDALVTQSLIDAKAARSAGQYETARHLLESAVDLHESLRFSLMTGRPLLELADLLLEKGDERDAIELAGRALESIGTMGAPGLLLQEGRGTYDALLEKCAAAGVQKQLIAQVREIGEQSQRPAGPVTVPGTGVVLTTREFEVLVRVAAGDSNRAIGEALYISERTVKTHMTSLLRKLGVSSRTQAAAKARTLGLVS